MNILHIHNFHFFRGGSATSYFKTAELLDAHGHSSLFFSMQHPKNLPCETSEFFMPYLDLNAQHSIVSQVKIAGRILYSFEARKRLSMLLDRYPVDIAHLQNIYHNFSPSILHELKKRKIPVVMTVNDPKLVCASHNWHVRGELCDACTGGRYHMAIVKRCIKDSLAKSILSTMEMYLHHKVLDIYDNVDVFIYPSLFFKNKFEEMGFKKEGVHLSYPLDTQELRKFDDLNVNVEKDSILFVGRLLADKGLSTLLEAVKLLSHEKNKIEIRIAGDGPLREELHEKVESEKINNVRFLGYMKHESLFQEIKNNIAVVLPAECHENYPLSIMEAFALGKPVIGSRLGGIPELVKDSERGLTFEAMNPKDLCEKIKYVRDNPDKAVEWGRNARMFVEQELNAEKHYNKLMEIYKQAIQKNLSRK